MKIDWIRLKGDWQEVVDDCRTTVHKDSLGKEPSEKFKKNILISEHSPIRDISIKWHWSGIKSWVVTHFVRHKWEKFVRTQRTDRTGVDRDEIPQGELIECTGEANVQHGIDTSRKRLCYMASKETREAWEEVKRKTREVDKYISDVFVPNCIYRCGCPEENGCKFFDNFCKKWRESGANVDLTNIQARYDEYNRQFYGEETNEQ